jgi:hypothetical protein
LLDVLLLTLALVPEGGPLSPADRADYERAVERARYQFVIGKTRSFDEVYPRSVFQDRVAREMAEERVLGRVFGMTVTPQLLSEEFDRIEKTTKAPDQWEAIKNALRNDRRIVEDVFCRPLLVDRALRAKFAFDQKIHADAHQKARAARNDFLAGRSVPEATTATLRRKAAPAPTTDELLAGARAQGSGPRVISPLSEPDRTAPLAPDPEVAAVLEKELQKPGDVSTILEERDRFQVLRLTAIDADIWTAQVVTYPKRDFDSWLNEEIRRVSSRKPAKPN